MKSTVAAARLVDLVHTRATVLRLSDATGLPGTPGVPPARHQTQMAPACCCPAAVGREAASLQPSPAGSACTHAPAEERVIDQRGVVPGDCVRLGPGGLVPADVRIVQARDLFIGCVPGCGHCYPLGVERLNEGASLDPAGCLRPGFHRAGLSPVGPPCRQAALTGESMPAHKSARPERWRRHAPLLECRCLAFRGTHVVSGASLAWGRHAACTARPVPPVANPTAPLAAVRTHPGTGLGLVVGTGGGAFISTIADQLRQQARAGAAASALAAHPLQYSATCRLAHRAAVATADWSAPLPHPQKPANAFQAGVRRVSYLLIAFMAAMVPVVLGLQAWMTGDWGQARPGGGGRSGAGAAGQGLVAVERSAGIRSPQNRRPRPVQPAGNAARRRCTAAHAPPHPASHWDGALPTLPQAALFGISVAVGLTPEMLPMIVNANLARGAGGLLARFGGAGLGERGGWQAPGGTR